MDGAEQAFHAVTGAMYKNPCDQDALRRMADERIAQILIVSRTSALRAPRVGSALGLGDEMLAVCPGAHTAPGALMSASRASRACSTDAVFTDSRVARFSQESMQEFEDRVRAACAPASLFDMLTVGGKRRQETPR